MGSESLTRGQRDTLSLFDTAGIPFTTSEVAEGLDLGRRATYARLEQLAERGCIETKKVGASGRVWWLSPKDDRSSASSGTSLIGTLVSDRTEPIVAIDLHGQFLWWNDRFEVVSGFSADELHSMQGNEILHLPTDERQTTFQAVLTSGSHELTPVFVGTSKGEHIRYEFRWTPITEADEIVGVSGIGHRRPHPQGPFEDPVPDIHQTPNTDDSDEDRDRYVTIVEAVSEPVYVLDLDGNVAFVNEAFTDLTGYAEEDLIGEHVSVGMPPEAIAAAEYQIRELLSDTTGATATLEFEVLTKAGNRVPVENRISLLSDEEGQATGTVGILWDITNRRAQQQELERTLDLLNEAERIADMGWWEVIVDDEEIYWSEHLFDILGVPQGSIPTLDEALKVCHADDRPIVENAVNDALSSGTAIDLETRIRRPNGDVGWLHVQGHPVVRNEDIVAIRGAAQDITPQKCREQELEARIRQLEVVAELGESAPTATDLDELLSHAVGLVGETLENEYCQVLEAKRPLGQFVLRQGAGWKEGNTGTILASAIGGDSQAAYTLDTKEPVILEDLERETRFTTLVYPGDQHVNTGISVIIGPNEQPWGVLSTHSTNRKTFDEHDVSFVQSVANILSTVITQQQSKKEIKRRREESAALNHLNEIVSDITKKIIRQSTREEIEQTVCDELAATNSYEFAWLAGIDTRADMFVPRAAAGTRGYHEAISISLDPEAPGSRGPGATAAREQTTQVVHDVFSDPSFSPWQDAAREYGFRSVASIPLVHDEAVYGVLGVYANRQNAFDTAETEVISRLGEVVGHAIASLERKRALVSDEVVELTFRVRDVFGALGIPAESEGAIALTGMVPIANNEFLLFGTATADAREDVQLMGKALAGWHPPVFHDTNGDTSFRIHVTDDPILAVLTSLGGSIAEATIVNGDHDLTVHLPPNADVRRLIDSIREQYPGMELVTRRQLTRSSDPNPAITDVMDSLTDRQRTVLQAAFHSGLFNWPRDSSGEEVASTLGIASTTFHYHLRKAEQKVIESFVLPTDDTTG